TGILLCLDPELLAGLEPALREGHVRVVSDPRGAASAGTLSGGADDEGARPLVLLATGSAAGLALQVGGLPEGAVVVTDAEGAAGLPAGVPVLIWPAAELAASRLRVLRSAFQFAAA